MFTYEFVFVLLNFKCTIWLLMQIREFLQSVTTTTTFKLIERDARVENVPISVKLPWTLIANQENVEHIQ